MTLGEYMTWLQDSNHLKQFLKNPERAMQKLNISQADRDLILGGDAEAFRDRLRQEPGWQEDANDVLYIVHPGNPPIVHP
jgi:hypothetical protein